MVEINSIYIVLAIIAIIGSNLVAPLIRIASNKARDSQITKQNLEEIDHLKLTDESTLKAVNLLAIQQAQTAVILDMITKRLEKLENGR